MAHGPGDSEYELRRARSMCPSAARISAGCGWPWVSGRPSRGSARTPALNANHARQTQRRLLGRSLTFPARTAPTGRRSLCAYEAAYGDSRPDGAAGGHKYDLVGGARRCAVNTRGSVACRGVPGMGELAVASCTTPALSLRLLGPESESAAGGAGVRVPGAGHPLADGQQGGELVAGPGRIPRLPGE